MNAVTTIQIVKRNGEQEDLRIDKLKKVIGYACKDYPACDPLELEMDACIQFRDGMTTKEIQRIVMQTAVEKTSVETPEWQFVAARLLAYDLYKDAAINRGYRGHFGYGDFTELVHTLTEKGLYGSYLLETYSDEEIQELQAYLKPERDELFNYAGLRLLADRYLIKDYDKGVMELPQERFMIIAMHLAMKEQDKLKHAKDFYDILSKLEITVATPTLANAGTPHHQLSSCFIDTVDDSLSGIMNTAGATSMVSKFGGGVGIYLGKVRSRGSSIRGHKGASGGIVPWTRLYNQIAISVDQLGTRAGAFAIYLDVWHADILDFLLLKTNNGDDRMKAHDIFPGVCIPDLFMERVKERGMWYLFDPHEVREVMGFSLEDSYGEEFARRYELCVQEEKLTIKTEIPAIEIMKRIMASAFETGTPFIFFRDTVNRANPNKHAGMVYSSNLCTEIMQNMSPTVFVSEELEDGEVVYRYRPGDFVVCNLSSLNLGRLQSTEDIARIVPIQMRMLDNVIDLNYYPVKQAEATNQKYRAVGLGTSGYHQYLAQNGIKWESEEHIEAADKLYEEIAYQAIKTSMELAREKGTYRVFEGSEWQTGEYFERRGYTDERWTSLKEDVARYGMRNAWTFAVAPTGTTSLIAGSTASTDPVYAKFFVEEKRSGNIPQTAPNLNENTFFYYKEAHRIDQQWSIRAAGARQVHIDQAQSFNLYITPQITAPEFLDLYIQAWENGLKTIYYVRNQSVEVEDCVSCSA
ncbi:MULTISPECIES: ribonucleoside-diphosphate reductase subunit alpha [Brevibacillus]|jgi:ribonucleoside-diphosphate reductase alpha chain|uniref:Ribonucleoside-diphosphate reductase n=1 Tax=Brevibacillus borstelensis AK1 TaxID=1300222 RepID=M8DIW7_9BACL|nr:ribonucleoside-diphosphate reductase subunit alpha [Brevibacillus borstelensis]EMT53518.1 protein NrdA [Brevibacillus borstelensis AK1]MCC0565990.1 ribonucleoside-diphosphate reductase subunit alpha [Brevibacillus borstelensis]MCM3469412.1 ribonucleoside-diphosphate reductase subunit alpha [Brevibacillus borstelensis]MCM3557296.1 ribonucleoside-diphosphate reductase subunit alpha [Brevibacillus borstelensis]MCM3590927.1 ribonucleoside-diphosphate reductase subunit alpha [Brevibacillus borst